jgi:hypothetical protein
LNIEHELAEIELMGDSRLLKHILHEVRRIRRFLEQKSAPEFLGVTFEEDSMASPAPVSSIVPGGSVVANISLLPAGSALPANATDAQLNLTSDDPNAVISTGPRPNTFTVTIPASDTQGSAPAGSSPSLNVTATLTSVNAGISITSGPVNLPISGAAPGNNPTGLEVAFTSS